MVEPTEYDGEHQSGGYTIYSKNRKSEGRGIQDVDFNAINKIVCSSKSKNKKMEV